MSCIFAALGCSLLLTLALESAFFFLCGKRDRRDFCLLLLCNLLTNPAVVLLSRLAAMYIGWGAPFVLLLELFASAAEGWLYWLYGRRFRHPLLFSAAANAFSYAAGWGLQRLL